MRQNWFITSILIVLAIIITALLIYKFSSNSSTAPPVATISPPITQPSPTEKCVLAGCNSELCLEESEARDRMTACVFSKQYGCLRNAKCERQTNGECGFTQTAELKDCLDKF